MDCPYHLRYKRRLIPCQQHFTGPKAAKNLQKHCHTRHGKSAFLCPNCVSAFPSRNLFRQHAKLCRRHPNFDGRRWRCLSCPLTFSLKQSLKRHAKRLNHELKDDPVTGEKVPIKPLPTLVPAHDVHKMGSFTFYRCSFCKVTLSSRLLYHGHQKLCPRRGLRVT